MNQYNVSISTEGGRYPIEKHYLIAASKITIGIKRAVGRFLKDYSQTQCERNGLKITAILRTTMHGEL